MKTWSSSLLILSIALACSSGGSNNGAAGSGGNSGVGAAGGLGGMGTAGSGAGSASGSLPGTGAVGGRAVGGSGASPAGGADGGAITSGGTGARPSGDSGGGDSGGSSTGGSEQAGGLAGRGGSGGTTSVCRTTRILQSAGYIDVADFNADGWLDLLIPHAASNVLLGSAQGFSSSNSLLVPDLTSDSHVRAAKMNSDNFVDFVTLNSGGKVSVFLGSGDGHFSLGHQQVLSAGAGVRLALNDFTQDGEIDLVYPTSSTGTLVFLAGNGDGTLATPAAPVGVGGQATDIAVGDLNEDGLLDLVAGSSGGGGGCNTLLGDGKGSFTLSLPICALSQAGGVAIARVDGDTHQDVVYADRAQDRLLFYSGLGDGKLATAAKESAVGDAPSDLRLMDLNADGKLDAVTINANTRDLSLALGNGDGSFQPPHAFKLPMTAATTAAGDLDKDGYVDLLVSYGVGIQIYYGPCSAP